MLSVIPCVILLFPSCSGTTLGGSPRQLWSVPCCQSSFWPAPPHTCVMSPCRNVPVSCCLLSLLATAQPTPHCYPLLLPSSVALGPGTHHLTLCPHNTLLHVSQFCRNRSPACSSSAACPLHPGTPETTSPASAQPPASVFPHYSSHKPCKHSCTLQLLFFFPVDPFSPPNLF